MRNPIPIEAARNLIPPTSLGHAAPAFAADANQFHVITIPLDNARTTGERFHITGTILWAIDASDLDANMTLAFNAQDITGLPFKQGIMVRGLKFDQVWITNTAQGGKSITLFYGVEGLANVNVENPFVAFTGIKVDQPDTLTTTADVAVATVTTSSILAARTDRRYVKLSNPAGNSREFRVGDSNTGAARGAILNPGERIVIDGTAEIFAYNPHTLSQSITILEVRD